MAVELQEYIGSKAINKPVSNSTNVECKEYVVDLDPISDGSIMQEIEGLHVGPTRNFTWYMESALDSSVNSWTKPYQKPLIMHHNEDNGKIIGRVCHVEKKIKNTRSGTPALLFTCNVPDKDGMEQIQDGRLKTVSVGVTAHDVICSICGEQIELDENGFSVCGHDRGVQYKKDNGELKTCYWEVYEMEAKELSYVIVPSDIYTHNIRSYKAKTNQKVGLSESVNNTQDLNLQEGEFKKMAIEKTNTELQEKANIEEEVKAGVPATEVATETETKEKVEEVVEDAKETEIKGLKAKVAKLEAEKELLSKDLGKTKEDLSLIVDKLDSVQAALKTEIVLKETVETKLIGTKAELREAVEENLNTLRSALNKPVALKESLQGRSIESIKDSIVDLKEELGGLNSVKNITEAVDETLKSKEIVKNTKIDVKEAKTDSNIDMTESVKDIMASLLL
jgi:hypothetical protein